MSPDKFGDSYDIVKREIIQWLAPPEEWAVHPMWFGPRRDFVEAYYNFLEVEPAEGDITRRRLVSDVGRACPKHLLLDPNTGLRTGHRGPPDSQWDHVTIEELADIACADGRESLLTLVFDQSIGHRTYEDAKEIVAGNLQTLREGHEVYGVAYVSHAAFIWVAKDEDLLTSATRQLLKRSRLPLSRFVDDGFGRIT